MDFLYSRMCFISYMTESIVSHLSPLRSWNGWSASNATQRGTSTSSARDSSGHSRDLVVRWLQHLSKMIAAVPTSKKRAQQQRCVPPGILRPRKRVRSTRNICEQAAKRPACVSTVVPSKLDTSAVPLPPSPPCTPPRVPANDKARQKRRIIAPPTQKLGIRRKPSNLLTPKAICVSHKVVRT